MTKRNTAGSQFVELAIALIVAFPVCLALFELAMIVNIAQVNDAAAREASRIGAAGSPSTADQRVKSVVGHVNQESHAMSARFVLVELTFNPADTLTQEAKMVPYGGTLKGDLTVKIQCTIKPYLISLFTNNNPITFNSQKTCPFTYNVPNTAGGMTPLP
jgi:hypothetical protein